MANFDQPCKRFNKIYFDVTYLFSLNIYTIVSFIVICILMLPYFIASVITLAVINAFDIGIYWRIVIIMLSLRAVVAFCKAADSNNTLINF